MPRGRLGGGAPLILILALILPQAQALEVLEQCRVQNKRTGEQAMANIKGRISYDKETHTVKSDFWKNGVAGSRRILKKVLKKINIYEEQHTKLEEQVNKKLGKRYRRLGKEDVWYDEKQNRPVYKDEFCATVDDLKATERKQNDQAMEIKYNCIETEQLYGIGYHKVYGACKDDPFLEKFSVDYSVCLHAHYPWIDMLHWGVCVMKEYNNDFLACFCSTKNGKLDKRSFCITKFECFLHGQGLTKPRQMLVVKDTCMGAIEYFTEPGVTEDKWLTEEKKNANLDKSVLAKIFRPDNPGIKWLDKLRVRAPYHMESTCFEEKFSSDFDIGQFKQDLTSTSIKIPQALQVEVHSPKLNTYKILREDKEQGTCFVPDPPRPPEPRVEEPQCGPRFTEKPLSPQLIWKKQAFIDIYTERMVTTSVPWIPGILFLYSYLLSEKSRKLKLFVNGLQFGVIVLGMYNAIVSMVLWRSALYTLSGTSQKELTVFVASFCFACCINYKEVGELFLILSLLHFCSNILLLYIVPHVRSEENIIACTGLSYIISTVLTVLLILLIWRQVDKIDKKREKEARLKQEMVDMIASGKSREGERRRPGRNKSSHQKRLPSVQKDDSKGFSQVYSEIEEEVKERSRISCQWAGCRESSNMGYVSVACSGQCSGRQYHTACWKHLLHSLDLREDRSVLGTFCPLAECQGRVSRLGWFTGLGREVTTRRLSWDPTKQGKRSSQPRRGDSQTTKRGEPRKVQPVAPTVRVQEPKVVHEIDVEDEKPEMQFDLQKDNFEDEMCPDDSLSIHELTRAVSYEHIANTFGTIGSERKARKTLPEPNLAESTPSLSSNPSPTPQAPYSNGLFDWIGDDDWSLEIPQPDLSCQPRSRFLSMIQSNQETDLEMPMIQSSQDTDSGMPKEYSSVKDIITQTKPTDADRNTGFIMDLDFCGRPSSSVQYCPESRPEGDQDPTPETSSLSVNYISGQPHWAPEEQSWLLDGYDSEDELYKQLEMKETPTPEPPADESDCLPLTRILRKALAGFTSAHIDMAMAIVLERVDCKNITIPEFQRLVQDQLEAGMPMDQEVEECHMCLEPLDAGPAQVALKPCLHVFHALCIQPWIERDSSCPKCRAKVS